MPKDWPYYLRSEVVVHNKPDDLWVSFLGFVYDLTPLARDFEGQNCLKPLLAYAGKDISHWFDKRTGDIKHIVHPITGVKVPYIPHGPLPHIQPQVPTTQWRPLEARCRPVDGKPWWQDKRYMIGYLTEKARPVRVVNVLAPESHRHKLIWVPEEHGMDQIVNQVMPHNASSYSTKFEKREVNMKKMLRQTRIPDERDKYLKLGLSDDNYIPSIQVYYKDDLKK